MTHLEELKQRYVNEAPKLPSKQLCLLELEIRAELAKLKFKHDNVLAWFKDNLGVPCGIYEYRVSLTDAIGCSGWADTVFERIDNGMSWTEGTGLIRRAIKRAKYDGDITLNQALQLELDELRAKKLTISHTSNKKSDAAAEKGIASKKLIASIELLVQEYMDEAAINLEPHLVSKLKNDFLDTIKLGYHEFRTGLVKSRSSAKDTALEKVGKKRFEDACKVLGMNKAKFGKPISLSEVKRRKNKRAIELHPDRNQHLPEPQREALNNEFNVVMEAYRVLNTYSNTFGIEGK